MPDMELKPTEVRKSERLPMVVIVWAIFCCVSLFGLALVVSDYNWKLAVGFGFPAMSFGYLVGLRFHITLKR
jgi:hypothetical protein